MTAQAKITRHWVTQYSSKKYPCFTINRETFELYVCGLANQLTLFEGPLVSAEQTVIKPHVVVVSTLSLFVNGHCIWITHPPKALTQLRQKTQQKLPLCLWWKVEGPTDEQQDRRNQA